MKKLMYAVVASFFVSSSMMAMKGGEVRPAESGGFSNSFSQRASEQAAQVSARFQNYWKSNIEQPFQARIGQPVAQAFQEKIVQPFEKNVKQPFQEKVAQPVAAFLRPEQNQAAATAGKEVSDTFSDTESSGDVSRRGSIDFTPEDQESLWAELDAIDPYSDSTGVGPAKTTEAANQGIQISSDQNPFQTLRLKKNIQPARKFGSQSTTVEPQDPLKVKQDQDERNQELTKKLRDENKNLFGWWELPVKNQASPVATDSNVTSSNFAPKKRLSGEAAVEFLKRQNSKNVQYPDDEVTL